MDPPHHNEWRRVLNRRFTPKAVVPLVERIRELTVALLDDLPAGEPVDAVDRLCAPLPVLAIAELLGVPDGDRGDFRRWSDAAIAATDGMGEMSPEDAAAMGELRPSSTPTPRRRPTTPARISSPPWSAPRSRAGP